MGDCDGGVCDGGVFCEEGECEGGVCVGGEYEGGDMRAPLAVDFAERDHISVNGNEGGDNWVAVCAFMCIDVLVFLSVGASAPEDFR